MFNQNIAAMLVAGLAMASARAEYIPDFSVPEIMPSRYEQVEPDYSWAPDAAVSSPDSQFTPAENTSYTFSEPVSPQCDQLAVISSRCIVNNEKTRKGLLHQIRYLKKYPGYRQFAPQGVKLSGQQLLTTADGVLRWLDSNERLTDRFELVNLTQYGDSQAKFTGYYTPEIAASWYYSSEYRYPVYRMPDDASLRGLSRAEINSGALQGRSLEIAWVKDPVALFYIHLQGSGVLAFENGERKILQFAGSNGHPYRSIASYMQQRGYLNDDLSRRAITAWIQQHPETLAEVLAANPRYVFFKLGDEMASSASGMELIPGHTVAVDTRFIPFGAVLLAEVPQVDSQGNVINYQWRLLFPQDRGNAIKGENRLDFYTGTGEMARRWANNVTGLRRAFLLLDKSQSYMQTATAKNY